MALDATQLTLIGQAYLRNASPAEELLNKLDSANVRIVDLCYCLDQMSHHRALDVLRPYLRFTNNEPNQAQNNNKQSIEQAGGTLCTPTPSFSDIQPAALISPSEFNLLTNTENFNNNPNEWNFLPDSRIAIAPDDAPDGLTRAGQAYRVSQDESRCHKSALIRPEENNHKVLGEKSCSNGKSDENGLLKKPDPGEEIVRLACSSNRKRTSITDQEVVNQLRLIMQISYNELKQASDDFSDANILGNGGFASVYRGYWKGTDVAIKRLRCNLMDQAFNELTILNSYRIDNILPIYGISIDGPEACLVYQFMANGSLEDRLSCKNGTPPLTWQQRAMIGEGVAKGLYYLHTLRDKPLVHGDAKSANVLLDSQFIPKLGDFGLARQVFKSKNVQTEHCTHCTVTSINGTSVYLPPEYLRHKILSPAVDVYSYGIVLLEMATGKRAYDGKRLLIDLVEDETTKIQMGGQQTICYSLKDPRLDDHLDQQVGTSVGLRIWFELLLRLGMNCAHKIKKKRPDMGQVLNHFAQFRAYLATTSPNTPISNHLLDGTTNLISATTASITTAATTRTLTPDLTAMDPKYRFMNKNDTPYVNDGKQQQGQSGTALMSIQEGETLPNYGQQEQQGPHINAGSAAVEAMIPLLTELGFVADDGKA